MATEVEGEESEYKPGDHYYGIRPPHKVPGGRWQCVKKHPDKRYPEEWVLLSTKPFNPSIDEIPPPGVEGPLYRTKGDALIANPSKGKDKVRQPQLPMGSGSTGQTWDDFVDHKGKK